MILVALPTCDCGGGFASRFRLVKWRVDLGEEDDVVELAMTKIVEDHV